MALYTYKLVTKKNELRQGTVSSLTKWGVKKALEKDGSTVLLLRAERSFFSQELSLPFGGFGGAERINFFRNFAILTGAGVSILEILQVLEEQVKGSAVKNALRAIALHMKNGKQLSAAMGVYSKYFSESLIERIHAGEISGRLSEALDKIAEDLEKDDELRKKVTGALAYPAIVTFVMLVVATTLVVYVLPEIAVLFEDFEAELPFITKALLYGSTFLGTYPLLLIGAFVAVAFAFYVGMKRVRTRFILHYLVLRVPVIGSLLKEYNIVLFFRTLESLFASGIPLPRAVEIATSTMQNDVYKKTLATTYPLLMHGISLSETIGTHPHLFPITIHKIIHVGERTGKMEEMFGRITAHYERAVDHKTKMLTIMLEPLLMLVIGGVVGSIALSIFLPLYSIVNSI